MDLDRLLARCRGLEARAAAVYRMFAARTRSKPEICAMWTALAREEDAHERALSRASSWLDRTDGWHISLVGWDEALEEIEERLADAERPELGADVDRMLLAALALERTEIDTLFHRLLGVMHSDGEPVDTNGHVDRLLAMAAESTNQAVQLEAALLRARSRLSARSESVEHHRAT